MLVKGEMLKKLEKERNEITEREAKVLGLQEENVAQKEQITTLQAQVIALKAQVVAQQDEITALKAQVQQG
jgi:predicted RNase H-like nuclease (RuvC/YqgF family)